MAKVPQPHGNQGGRPQGSYERPACTYSPTRTRPCPPPVRRFVGFTHRGHPLFLAVSHHAAVLLLQVLCSFLTERRFGCLSRPPVAEHLTPKVMNRVLCTVLPPVRHVPPLLPPRTFGPGTLLGKEVMVPPYQHSTSKLQLTPLRHLARHKTLCRSHTDILVPLYLLTRFARSLATSSYTSSNTLLYRIATMYFHSQLCSPDPPPPARRVPFAGRGSAQTAH